MAHQQIKGNFVPSWWGYK